MADIAAPPVTVGSKGLTTVCRLPWHSVCSDTRSLLPGQCCRLDPGAGPGECISFWRQLQSMAGSKSKAAAGRPLYMIYSGVTSDWQLVISRLVSSFRQALIVACSQENTLSSLLQGSTRKFFDPLEGPLCTTFQWKYSYHWRSICCKCRQSLRKKLGWGKP